MDQLLIQRRLNIPVVTGTPAASPVAPQQEQAQASLQQRSIELTENSLERLYEGVRIAREKGMDDTLILVDSTAFIVSVKNGTVITTLGGDLRGSAITNINGTVIV